MLVFLLHGRTLAAALPNDAIRPTGAIDLWDLTYYDRHIAGNLRYHLDRLRTEGLALPHAEGRAAWSQQVMREGLADG